MHMASGYQQDPDGCLTRLVRAFRTVAEVVIQARHWEHLPAIPALECLPGAEKHYLCTDQGRTDTRRAPQSQ